MLTFSAQNLTHITLGLAGALSLYLAKEDYKSKEVPLWGLLAWGVLSLYFAYITKTLPWELSSLSSFVNFLSKTSLLSIWEHHSVFSILFLFSASTFVFQKISKINLIGIADLFVLIALSPFLSLDGLHLLFGLSGLFCALTYVIVGSKTIPFLPGLFLASYFCIIIEKFKISPI